MSSQLRTELDQAQHETERLMSVVVEKDAKIRSLVEELASYKSSCPEEAENVRARMQAQNSRIVELGSEFEEDCWRLENDIHERAQEVQDLEALLAMKDDEIEKQQKELAVKDATIGELDAKIEASKGMKSQLDQKLAEISILKGDMMGKDDEIARLKEAIDRQYGATVDLSHRLSECERFFDEAETSSHTNTDAVPCDKTKRVASLEEMVAGKCNRAKELECSTVRTAAASENTKVQNDEDQLNKCAATDAARSLFNGPSTQIWGAAAATTSKAVAAARHHAEDENSVLATDQKREQDQEHGVEKDSATSTTTTTADSSSSFICIDPMP